MALLDIVVYPKEPLLKAAAPVKKFGPELAKFVEDMQETMEVFDGVGLAAPQVGVSRRILVYRLPEEEAQCLINPEILDREGSETAEEGCLSLPMLYAPVARARKIRVRALDLLGNPREFEAAELEARVIQHECDHLDGMVILDRLDVLTRRAKLQEWDEICQQLGAASQSE